MELKKTEMVTPMAKSIFGVLKEAHNLYGEYRVKIFLAAIDSEVDNMSSDQQERINEFLNQKKSKKVLADYASAITNTSSEVVLRALALLFIDDRQFDFSNSEKARFVACTNGLDDLKANLFIKLSSLKKNDSETVYATYKIHHQNFDSLGLGVEVDELFAYTEDLLKRGLILRDPRGNLGSNFWAPKGNEWSICFGISSTLRRYAALLDKAKLLAGRVAP